MAKEIEIPEGYEARIKGNKVIIEKKESEDERIRKEIIDFLIDGIWDETAINKVKQTQRYAKWVEYLNKKKEQKPLEEIAKEVTKDKESAIKFLKSAGIMDENGELAEIYRNDPDKPEEEKRTPLDFVSVGDIVTYFRDGKKGIMLISSFDYGDGDLSKSAPRCKWGISDIGGTAYGNWAPGGATFYEATEEERSQLIKSMPFYVEEWWSNLLKTNEQKPSEKERLRKIPALKKLYTVLNDIFGTK